MHLNISRQQLEVESDHRAQMIPPAPPMRTSVVFHVGDASGPLLSLKSSLAWLADSGTVEAILPWEGSAISHLGSVAAVRTMDYCATLSSAPSAVIPLVPGRDTDLKRFRTLFRTSRPDLVLVATTVLPAPLLAARAEGIPTLLYAAELFSPEWGGRIRAAAGRALARAGSQRAAATICCSDRVRQQFDSRVGGPLVTIYPDIAPDIGGGDGHRFRRLHGIDDDAVCVGVAGNLTRGRGQDLMLRALSQIRAQLPRVCCVIAGTVLPRSRDAAYRDELYALIDELDLTAAVRWCGSVDDMADFYAASNIVVNPARHCESFGRVAVEALVAGRPVVSTRVGAVPEVLRDGRDALLVESNRPDELAGAVIRLATDLEFAARLAREGGRRARAEFTPFRAVGSFGRLVSAVRSTALPSSAI